MRQIISVSAILLCFCTPSLHAQTASPNSIGTQNIPYTPAAPIAPKDIRECMDFQNQIDAFKSAVGAQHQACLDSGKSTRPGGTGPGSQCSVPACQTLHDYLYGNAAAGMDQEAAACRAAVLRYQNRQTAERDSIQTMADAIATLAAPTAAAPIDSQSGLSDFDQQAQSQAVTGDNSGSNLAVSDDVQALAQNNSSQAASGIGDNDINSLAVSAGAPQAVVDQPDDYSPHDAQRLLEEGFGQTTAGQVVKDIQDIRSDDGQKQLNGTFDLADKANDQFNTNSSSKYVVSKCLPMIHNIYSNTMSLVNSMGQDMHCITDPNCSGVGSATETKWNQIQRQPLKFFSPPADENVFDQ
jgi:hypothetical protein